MLPNPLASPTLSHDLPCLQCRYNLRTLDPAARCPECHTPIHHSITTDQYLKSLGPTYLRLAAALFTLLSISGTLYAIFLYRSREYRSWPFLPTVIDDLLQNYYAAIHCSLLPICLLLGTMLLVASVPPQISLKPLPAKLVLAMGATCALVSSVVFFSIASMHSRAGDAVVYIVFDRLLAQFTYPVAAHTSIMPLVYVSAIFYPPFIALLFLAARYFLSLSRMLHRPGLRLLLPLWILFTLLLPLSDVLELLEVFLHSHLPERLHDNFVSYFFRTTTLRYLSFYLAQLLFWPALAMAIRRRDSSS